MAANITIKETAEAYAIAVKAGLITPCLDDENAFRKMLGLKPACPDVEHHYAVNGGVKQIAQIATIPELPGSSYMTVNEMRERVGLKPITGGDAIYRSSGDIPAIEIDAGGEA